MHPNSNLFYDNIQILSLLIEISVFLYIFPKILLSESLRQKINAKSHPEYENLYILGQFST